jgi:hypothetical protein
VLIEQKGTRKYEGMWVLSRREGRGQETFANGDVYIGEFSNDRFDGQGELTTKGGKYKGTFKDGLKNGLGTLLFKNNSRYEGAWKLGRFHGKGLYVWQDTRKYEGEWLNGERNGPGIMYFPNGEKHDGNYLNNKKHGPGWWRLTSGKVRPGEWKEDQLVRWTGPEQFEAQMKAKRLKEKNIKL